MHSLCSYLTPWQVNGQTSEPSLGDRDTCAGYLGNSPQVEARQLSFDRRITCLGFHSLRITGTDGATAFLFLGYSQHVTRIRPGSIGRVITPWPAVTAFCAKRSSVIEPPIVRVIESNVITRRGTSDCFGFTFDCFVECLLD